MKNTYKFLFISLISSLILQPSAAFSETTFKEINYDKSSGDRFVYFVEGDVDKNTISAEDLKSLKQKAESGDAEAQYKLAQYYLDLGDAQNMLLWVDRAAKQGHPDAINGLGTSYFFGIGVKKDKKRGLELLIEAEKKGSKKAIRNLAGIYYQEGDYKKAFEWATKALEFGESNDKKADATNLLAILYLYGNGVKMDRNKAIELLKKACELGSNEALGNLASAYLLQKDYKKAFGYAQRGVEAGSEIALEVLGNLYLYGEGVEIDKDKALEIFKKLLALGNPVGNAYIAIIYEEKGDYEKAFEWASKGAKLNDIKSISVLGSLYLNDQYVKRDLEKAKELLLRAAEFGNENAMGNLAGALIVSRDYEKAFEWAKKGAEKEDSNSLNTLGLLYMAGMGVEQDSEKAKACFIKANELGSELALKNLQRVYFLNKEYDKVFEYASKVGDVRFLALLHAEKDFKEYSPEKACAYYNIALQKSEPFTKEEKAKFEALRKTLSDAQLKDLERLEKELRGES